MQLWPSELIDAERLLGKAQYLILFDNHPRRYALHRVLLGSGQFEVFQLAFKSVLVHCGWRAGLQPSIGRAGTNQQWCRIKGIVRLRSCLKRSFDRRHLLSWGSWTETPARTRCKSHMPERQSKSIAWVWWINDLPHVERVDKLSPLHSSHTWKSCEPSCRFRLLSWRPCGSKTVCPFASHGGGAHIL